ncbi:hypothetical protein OHA25_43195 [Nonomuraea sp. NBC_00507]|uniref:hypothetical protein n=1 Tax=Nonomuraea sp. NBC_00507 TaxID=2976002 RepID=UPI002E19435C
MPWLISGIPARHRRTLIRTGRRMAMDTGMGTGTVVGRLKRMGTGMGAKAAMGTGTRAGRRPGGVGRRRR